MATSMFPALQPRYSLDIHQEPRWDSPSSAYEESVKVWCNAAWEEAEFDQKASEELKLMSRFIDYINGKQWKTGQRASYKATPVLNKTSRLFWELMGQLTDVNPFIQVKSTDPDEGVVRQEHVINGGLQSWSLDTDFDLKLAMCTAYATLTTGFCKMQYNPQLNMGAGEMEMVPLAPDRVLPLKPKDTLHSGEGVIYWDMVPLRYFRERYPDRAALVQPDLASSQWATNPGAPAHLSAQLFDMLSPAMQRTLAGSPKMQMSAFPMARLREFWIRDETRNQTSQYVRIGQPGRNWSYKVAPGGKLYPRGRLIVMGGDAIMHDGPNPYWHGRFPFDMLRLNVVPWSFYGLPEMKSWIDLQDIVNQILAGVLDVVKKATNPAWYAPKNAFSEAVWQTLDFGAPGARAQYSPSSAHEPKFAPPPQLPGFILPLMQSIEREMDQQSVGALASEAARKKQIPGADALDALKAEKTTPVRLKGRNIEIFLRNLGQQAVPNMFQFWDSKKRLQRLGSNGLTWEDFDWDPHTMIPFGTDPVEHIRKFKFMVEPGSLLKMASNEKRLELVTLRRMGEISRKRFFVGAKVNVDFDANERELREEAPPLPKKKGGHK